MAHQSPERGRKVALPGVSKGGGVAEQPCVVSSGSPGAQWPCVALVSCLNVVLAVLLVVFCKLGYDRSHLPNLSLTLVHMTATLVALRLVAGNSTVYRFIT